MATESARERAIVERAGGEVFSGGVESRSAIVSTVGTDADAEKEIVSPRSIRLCGFESGRETMYAISAVAVRTPAVASVTLNRGVHARVAGATAAPVSSATLRRGHRVEIG